MPRNMGWVRIRGHPLPLRKLCKNTRNTANRVEVQHCSDIKNHEKMTYFTPRNMGWVRIHGPPFLPHKKTTLCKNTQNTANRLEVQHFSDIKNYEKT